ncbi:S-layer homology domain-containing protein [Jeotgalibacillus salarius]|uniref:S-layer homology domain-containing protein n=1 Tax=Jeotgalibacillus salarius TaxID=546023 RepID=A0A4Y8LSS5_9BACL|nr:S-layer homology domain-containing protein [Jeotgalibacillus salarius]TFE04005.1 S-layer homology domain-containing protein [Jeotgalibacillus salarius]
MKKVVTSILGLGLAAGLVQPVSAFDDVNQYEDEINFLTDQGIIKGYEDGSFGPANEVNRLQAVQMILREMDVTDFNAPNPGFTDMNEDDYGYKEVAKAVELGIISGKTDENGAKYFDPYNSLTRAQMAKILSESYGIEKEWRYFFSDVDRQHWAKEYVDQLASQAITTGYEDQTFRPEEDIQRQHFAVFMSRLLNEDFITTSNQENISFMKDQNKSYVYEQSVGEQSVSYVSTFNGYHLSGAGDEWELWLNTYNDGDETEGVSIETSKGLFVGLLESEYAQVLAYPIELGEEWIHMYGEEPDARIVDTNATITTQAGTFEHVVVVEDIIYPAKRYYAPNIGIIKTEDMDPNDNSDFKNELIEIRE